jgi:hypothetical protein
MSTLQTNPRGPDTHNSRIGAAVTALGALIAIGVTVLILTLTGSGHTTIPSGATPGHGTTTHIRTACTRYFRDPGTHALICVQRAGHLAGP